MSRSSSKPSVAVVGGGLAGLAAASVLCQRDCRVELFEARHQLGGRAGSFREPATGGLVDHCQHVGMGCCTNLASFCRRLGIAPLFRPSKVLYFFGPNGRRFEVRASRWLPAPLHLAPSLLRMGYLSQRERIGIVRALGRLARRPADDSPSSPTIGQWLRDQRQSERAIRRFWSAVLVSALGERVDRASLAAARKVFVDGFLAHRQAYQIEVPTVPLGELYGRRVADWLRGHGATLHLAAPVVQLEGDAHRILALKLAAGRRLAFDHFVIALPWRRVGDILPPQVVAAVPELQTADQIPSAPITSVHLWLDRSITPLPHAVLIDRLSQWMFNRGEHAAPGGRSMPAHYYQVVISASRELPDRGREDVLREVLADLTLVWPAAQQVRLLHWRIVTQRDAVFSAVPGLQRLRPRQQTVIPNLFLAGDWTRTGWPSTMEGAVRSGYLAAERLLEALGRTERLVQPDLPRGWLARRLIR